MAYIMSSHMRTLLFLPLLLNELSNVLGDDPRVCKLKVKSQHPDEVELLWVSPDDKSNKVKMHTMSLGDVKSSSSYKGHQFVARHAASKTESHAFSCEGDESNHIITKDLKVRKEKGNKKVRVEGIGCEFSQIDVGRLTPAELQSLFQAQDKPLLLKNVFPEWEKIAKTSSKAGFLDAFGHLNMSGGWDAKFGVADLSYKNNFRDWAENLGTAHKSMADKMNNPSQYNFHPCFMDPECVRILLSTYGIPDILKNYTRQTFIVAGGKSKGVNLHSHDSTWAAVLAGAPKTWFVAPPGEPPVEPFVPHSAEELRRNKRLKYCNQGESEVVFLPPRWWHATFNAGDWSLAIVGQGASPGPLFAAAVNDLAELANWPASKKEEMQPIHVACNTGQVPTVEYLLAQRAEVNQLDGEGGERPIHHAAHGGHVDVTKLLLNARANPEAIVEEFGVYPMHSAMYGGGVEVGKLLLAARSDINRLTPHDRPPIAFAAQSGHLDAVKWLMSVGATLDDELKEMLVDDAESEGHKDLARLLSSSRTEL